MRAALIPMKELAQAKMRLASVLDARERSGLALAMLTDVITVCQDSGCFDLIAVTSNDSEVFWHARELGARPIAEPATLRRSSGVQALNDGLTFAQRYLARRIAVDEIVILPADLPLVQVEDVGAVVVALGAPEENSEQRTENRGSALGAEQISGDGSDPGRVVIVRSGDNGTNALGLRPPEVIGMRFGRDSADAHAAAAREAGAEVIELDLPRLKFDLDAPEDLDALPSLPLGAATRGWAEARAEYAR